MEDSRLPCGDSGCRLRRVDSSSGRLASDQPHALIIDKMIERPDGIRAAAYTGEHCIRKFPFFLHQLLFDLF